MSDINHDALNAAIVLSAACAVSSLTLSFFIGRPILGVIIGVLGFAGSLGILGVLFGRRYGDGTYIVVISPTALAYLIPPIVMGGILGFLFGLWGRYVRLKRISAKDISSQVDPR